MNQIQSDFFIANKNIPFALEAAKELDNRTYGYAWVESGFSQSKSLHELMDKWGWEINYDDEGNVVEINFLREKIGDEINLFKAIAPYVKNLSFIEMQGEDATIWRWVFKDDTCMEVYPEINWNY